MFGHGFPPRLYCGFVSYTPTVGDDLAGEAGADASAVTVERRGSHRRRKRGRTPVAVRIPPVGGGRSRWQGACSRIRPRVGARGSEPGRGPRGRHRQNPEACAPSRFSISTVRAGPSHRTARGPPSRVDGVSRETGPPLLPLLPTSPAQAEGPPLGRGRRLPTAGQGPPSGRGRSAGPDERHARRRPPRSAGSLSQRRPTPSPHRPPAGSATERAHSPPLPGAASPT
jgi:hypothetical protein